MVNISIFFYIHSIYNCTNASEYNTNQNDKNRSQQVHVHASLIEKDSTYSRLYIYLIVA